MSLSKNVCVNILNMNQSKLPLIRLPICIWHYSVGYQYSYIN